MNKVRNGGEMPDGGKKNSGIRDAILGALSDSKNVYLSTKLAPLQSSSLHGLGSQITSSFDSDDIIELPAEHHLTWSFLGTKTKEQLVAFHQKLLEQRPSIQEMQVQCHSLTWFRSFLDGRIILALEPSHIDKEKLLIFRQSLRMEQRKPQRDINEFKPHITLAQISSRITDELVNACIYTHMQSIESNTPTISFESLWFHGKGQNEKISMEISP